ncbi:hypothetical protein ASE73_10425 [Sphingomonas sp. Leaf24]|uniref:hypothetical protein n=1 Tax=unclassified Sphingomonas TaxID=196159 RepID=UPI0006FCE09C|nr:MULTISPECIES: hypothetical protein [unclassified Sphingomonas]KQM14563.1 hypothetical protein ASE50_08475 [Sphingomonas sp. Leaf5]KQM87864.1 hypothetical protein ASE73_10425 [Sphingomonas sp. Leaf24]
MRAALVRGTAVAEQRAAEMRARVVATAAAVPGVRAEAVDDAVVLSGKRLARRTIVDPRLQDIAGWGR